MPDFQGSSAIILQPSTSSMPYRFTFTVCSSATANDGHLPYGTTIASVLVTATSFLTRASATSEIVKSSSVADNVVTVTLSYPSTSGEGRYRLTFVYTLNTGAVGEADFARVYATNM